VTSATAGSSSACQHRTLEAPGMRATCACPELSHVISPVAHRRIPEDLAILPSNSLGWDIPLSKGSKRDFEHAWSDIFQTLRFQNYEVILFCLKTRGRRSRLFANVAL